MQIYSSPILDPSLNLAMEEYLFRNSAEDLIILYTNQTSIIIGKHQNLLAEVNFQYCFANNIPLLRRISGGGTVYHGKGNLNYSFILSREKSGLNYHKNLIPLQKFFEEILNLNIETSPRNDLWLHAKKISGTAEHILKNRVLHHGTLLYDANLEELHNSLSNKGEHYRAKAVESVRASTTNIVNHLATPLPYAEFSKLLAGYLKHYFNAEELVLSEEDHQEILEIANSKYRTREWNFAYPKKYEFEKSMVIGQKKYEVELKVDHRVIIESIIRIDNELIAGISLKGVQHAPQKLNEMLSETRLWPELKGHYLALFF